MTEYYLPPPPSRSSVSSPFPPPRETVKYGHWDIRVRKFLAGRTTSVQCEPHPPCIREILKRNHYIASKQRKVAVFSSDVRLGTRSLRRRSLIPRLYSIHLDVYTYVRARASNYRAILRSVKILPTIARYRVNKSVPSFCHEYHARKFRAYSFACV